MDDRSTLEKIINEISAVSLSENNSPALYEDSNGSFAQFHSTMEQEIIIETARKYLHMPYYSIFIRTEFKDVKFIYISIYKSGGREFINFDVNLILGCTEINDGFIYKYRSPYSNSTCYIYIPNFDVITEDDRPSRKRETLAFYCKLLSYDKINTLYKKYTGKGLSEATYLKHNLL